MTRPIHLNHNFKDLAFRRTKPIPQWSSYVDLDVPYDKFLYGMTAVVEGLRHPMGGIVTRDPDTANVTSFTHTRFRRNKFGNPPEISECEQAIWYLAFGFQTSYEPESRVPGLTRIVLGLTESQRTSDASTGTAGPEPDYSAEDVKEALGKGYTVSPAEVCFVGLSANGKAIHSAKEVAVVEFPSHLKERAYLVGHAMQQERFSVEVFAGPRSASYMVETEWCQEPDPVWPVITPIAEPPPDPYI